MPIVKSTTAVYYVGLARLFQYYARETGAAVLRKRFASEPKRPEEVSEARSPVANSNLSELTQDTRSIRTLPAKECGGLQYLRSKRRDDVRASIFCLPLFVDTSALDYTPSVVSDSKAPAVFYVGHALSSFQL